MAACCCNISFRCVEPASSSPSKKNLILYEGVKPDALIASNANSMAITPALSSELPLPTIRHSGFILPVFEKLTNSFCSRKGPLMMTGLNGCKPFPHLVLSTGCPS